MSRFPERTASALVLIDAQNGLAEALDNAVEVIEVIAQLVSRARLAGVPVVWLRRVSAERRPGEPSWQLVDALVPQPAEVLLDHGWDDGFIDTDLADTLGGLGVGHLWLAGLGSDAGVLHTYLGALHRGFDVSLIEDAHAAAAAEFDGCRFSADQVVGFVNRIVWRDLAPDVVGDLVSSPNVEFAATELDDATIIALAEAEVARDEDAAFDN